MKTIFAGLMLILIGIVGYIAAYIGGILIMDTFFSSTDLAVTVVRTVPIAVGFGIAYIASGLIEDEHMVKESFFALIFLLAVTVIFYGTYFTADSLLHIVRPDLERDPVKAFLICVMFSVGAVYLFGQWVYKKIQ